jgi:hypothetical protein
MKRGAAGLALALLATPLLAAEDLPEWFHNTTIGGYFFGDAYGVISNHDPEIDGANGFWFRRAYLTFDTQVSRDIAVRLRFEANSPGDFTTSSNLEPYLKDLHVRWKLGRHEIYAGLSPSVTLHLIESHWDYRQVEKTPLDLYKWGASRDIGISAKGHIDGDGRFRYHVMLANGAGTSSETNDGKKSMLSLSFHPSKSWAFELYGDVDDRPDGGDRTTWQAFAACDVDRGRLGVQYARQTRKTGSAADLDLDVASTYGALALDRRFSVLWRVDRAFDPVPDGDTIDYLPLDPTARFTFALLGLDVALHEKVDLIPNVEAVFYEGVGGDPDPEDDVIARVTLFVQF